MNGAPWITLARRIEEPVRELDAMLVPLAQGWRDSKGAPRPFGNADALRLATTLDAAAVAIQAARLWIQHHQPKDDHAVQPRD